MGVVEVSFVIIVEDFVGLADRLEFIVRFIPFVFSNFVRVV